MNNSVARLEAMLRGMKYRDRFLMTPEGYALNVVPTIRPLDHTKPPGMLWFMEALDCLLIPPRTDDKWTCAVYVGNRVSPETATGMQSAIIAAIEAAAKEVK